MQHAPYFLGNNAAVVAIAASHRPPEQDDQRHAQRTQAEGCGLDSEQDDHCDEGNGADAIEQLAGKWSGFRGLTGRDTHMWFLVGVCREEVG